MKTMNAKGQKILKLFHLLAAAFWCGGILCIFISLLNPSVFPAGYEGLLNLISNYMVIPSAWVVMFTSIIYGFFTKWGFFKNPWIAIKWLLTLAIVVLGAALPSHVYVSTAQIAIMTIIFMLSIFKPFKKQAPKQITA